MRNRYLCLIMVLVLALPLVLASCKGEVEIVDEAAPIYTLYLITDDATTEYDLTQIEYEINRTLFYRIGSIVKLVTATEAEYEEMLQAKIDEVTEFDKKVKDRNSTEKVSFINTAKLSDNAIKNGYTAMSGEAILEDLQAGIPIEPECPRLDLFLITDYDRYLEMAENGDLAALDTVLNNEAKAIKSYIHTSFFNAAKVGNKTYGVPCNTTIGEYTYVVFDKEILDSTNTPLETLVSMDDLADYLEAVNKMKESDPSIIPLKAPIVSTEFNFMLEDGFHLYVDNEGYVHATYKDNSGNVDSQALEFFTMIAKYKQLGYFESKDGLTYENVKDDPDSNIRFAARFETGSSKELKTFDQNGWVYNQYSVPVATSKNSINCIYGLSSLCPQSWQTKAMEILTELYTDANLQNTLLYGLENIHYKLEKTIINNTEYNQVIRLNPDNPGYKMNPEHTGNCFIAYTDKDNGDSLTKWDEARKQNIDAIESRTIGFTYEPKKYVFGTRINEDGEEEEWSISEPDYYKILWDITEPYYRNLFSGSAVEFDYATALVEATAKAENDIYNTIFKPYQQRLYNEEKAKIEEEIRAELSAQYEAEALLEQKIKFVKQVSNTTNLKKVRVRFKTLKPDDMTEEEFLAKNPFNRPEYAEMTDSAVADIIKQLKSETINSDGEVINETYLDYFWEYRDSIKTIAKYDEDIAIAKEDRLKKAINARVSEELGNGKVENEEGYIPGNEEYLKKVEALKDNEKFLKELKLAYELETEDTALVNVNTALSELISAAIREMLAECDEGLKAAIDQFTAEYAEATKELYEQGVLEKMSDTLFFPEASDDERKAHQEEWLKFIKDNASLYSNTLVENDSTDKYKEQFNKAIMALVTKQYPELSESELGQKASDVLKVFKENFLPLYEIYYNKDKYALYEIGYYSTKNLTLFTKGAVEEEPEEDEGGGKLPGIEQTKPGNFKDYYDFVISAKFRTPYYSQFGTPDM